MAHTSSSVDSIYASLVVVAFSTTNSMQQLAEHVLLGDSMTRTVLLRA